ncbi:S8 family serine peptidase [Lewinella sp. JB7]|uniref:S8 family serine peptidase n=1 Tax=Lewinella sp. JB7 TaxID=2962887 RepID=UPI0020C94921|nr:S8 family serine peptidase [Lewinella sp. JB7]MCP9234488.1 S8 family serine peptidase [Lewinella sp. JB7]
MKPPKHSLRWLGAGLLAAGLWLTRRRSKESPRQSARLRPSDPDKPTPDLLRFDRLGEAVHYRDPELPKLDDDCSSEGNYRMARLSGFTADSFTLHVYNGSPAVLQLRVYGRAGEKIKPLTECIGIGGVVKKVAVSPGRESFAEYIVRFSLADNPEGKFDPADFVALAVYEREPPPQPGIRYRKLAGGGADDPGAELSFSHDRKSFQRIVLSSCEADGDYLRKWASKTGLGEAEAYFGPLGSVVVLGVPPGLDPDTTGGATARIRPEKNTVDATAEPDYIVNARNANAPTERNGKVRKNTRDPLGGEDDDFRPQTKFDDGEPPIVVAVIDGGVDYSTHNQGHWQPSRYDQPLESEFVKTGGLGYDFIHKDSDPQDEAPHGTYVAGAIIGGYRAAAPLKLVHFKIFGTEAISSYFGALVAIYEAATVKSTIINMSWGMYAPKAPPALQCALEAAVKQGCYLVTSAGNDQTNIDQTPQWPAAFAPRYPKHMITTASFHHLGKPDRSTVQLRDFSNFGARHVTVAAYQTTRVPEFNSPDTTFPLGTSISAPIVTATLAQFLAENPGATLADFTQLYERAPALASAVTGGAYLPVERSGVVG